MAIDVFNMFAYTGILHIITVLLILLYLKEYAQTCVCHFFMCAFTFSCIDGGIFIEIPKLTSKKYMYM